MFGIDSMAVRMGTLLVAVGLCTTPASGAEDFASLFAEDFEGISLQLPDAGQALAERPNPSELEALTLPGFPLTDEELSHVLRITDPVVTRRRSGDAGIERPTIGERLVNWVRWQSRRSGDVGVLSALAREEDEPGVRVDIDPDAEEVIVEYRVGF